MPTEVTLPQLGESVTEGTITAWLVQVGDTVEADQPLFELSSDKIDTEVPAPTGGTLLEIKVDVDETVDVGTVVAVIGEADEAGGAEGAPTSPPDEAEAEAEVEGDESAAGRGEREEVAAEAEEPSADAEDEEPSQSGQPATPAVAETMYEREDDAHPEERPDAPKGTSDGDGEGVLASPLVRRMVAEHGLDLAAIAPTGEGGRVTREDVEKAVSTTAGGTDDAAQESRPASAPSSETVKEQPQRAPQPVRSTPMRAGERERVEDLSRIRQRIAAKMMESQQSSAQLTTVQEADVSVIMDLRSRVKGLFTEREGISLSPFVFLARATVLALRKPEHATVNAQADWDAGKVKFHDYVNLGIAVDTPKGLLVPNVKNADDLTLAALGRGIQTAADKARGKGKLEMHDIEGGTFTLTNTGSRGVLIDTPILNYPEVGILGTGAIKKRPVVTADDAIAIRHMVYLCLTYDHRLLDGADAARFVTEVKDIIETHDWEQEIGY